VFLLRFLTHSPTSHDITRCWLSGISTCNVAAAVVFVVVSVGLTALYNVRGAFKFYGLLIYFKKILILGS
jgi:hypothetical protein